MQFLLQAFAARLGRLLGVPRRLLSSAIGEPRCILQVLVAASFCWCVASSLYVYPHSLSYGNELVGGPRHLPEHLLGSNADWGQDLRYLKWWMEERPNSEPLRLAYVGLLNANDLEIKSVRRQGPGEVLRWSLSESPELREWAISVNRMWGKRSRGNKTQVSVGFRDFRFASRLNCKALIGYSFYIFSAHSPTRDSQPLRNDIINSSSSIDR